MLSYKKDQVVENYLKDELTDEEIQDYYDENIFGDLTVRHILIEPDTDSDASDEDQEKAEEEAKKTAEEIIKKLDDGEKFEVLEGSEIDMSRKCHSDNIEKLRQTAIQNGNIVCSGDKHILNVSVPFTSPSSAAMFVLGGSTNGWIEWKNKDGKTLDEMYRK